MATFNVVWEIELDADNPLEAAKKAEEWLKNPDNHWQYYVQGDDKKIHSVDLEEEDEDASIEVDDYTPLIQ
jgi:hypothetical protein